MHSHTRSPRPAPKPPRATRPKYPKPLEHEDRTGCRSCTSGREAFEHEERIARNSADREAAALAARARHLSGAA